MNQAKPLFSIVTPAFNCATKIDTTIQSVLSQDESLWEYWVIDGESTDDTVKRLRSYEPKLNFMSEADRGIYDAMNKGISLVKGQYVYFIGAGDHLMPGVLSKVEEAIRQFLEKKPLFMYGNVHWISRGLRKYNGAFTVGRIRQRNICHQSIFYHNSVFKLLGNYEVKYTQLADWAFNMKCFGDKRVSKHYIDVTIADYQGNGVSENVIDEQFAKDLPYLIRSRLGLYQAARQWLDSTLGYYCNRVMLKLKEATSQT